MLCMCKQCVPAPLPTLWEGHGYKATVWPCYSTKTVHEDPMSSSGLDNLLIMSHSKVKATNQCIAGTQPQITYTPSIKGDFLGLTINSNKKVLSSSIQKLIQIRRQARKLLKQNWISVREIAQFVGRLSATAMANQPPSLQKPPTSQVPSSAREAGLQ